MFKAKTTLSLLVLIPALSLKAVAQSADCRQIQCDCQSLRVPSTVEACSAQEKIAQQQCANTGQITRYCGWHGPNGFPTALSLDLPKGDFSTHSVDALKIENQWNAVHVYTDMAKIHVDQDAGSKLADAIVRVRNALKDLFIDQQSMVFHGASTSTWKDYETNLRQAIKEITQVENKIWQKAQSSQDASKAWEKLALRMSLNSGIAMEQRAYALEQLEKDKSAARAWKDAAKQSADTLAKIDNSESYLVDYFNAKTAHRWYRSAWNWAKLDKTNEAFDAEQNALKFFGENTSTTALSEDTNSTIQPSTPSPENSNSLSRAQAWFDREGTTIMGSDTPPEEQNTQSQEDDGASKWGLKRRNR